MNPLIHFRKSIALSFMVLVLGSFTQKAQAGSPTPAMQKGKSAQAANAATKSDANKPSPVPALLKPSPVPSLPIWNPCNTATGNGALSSNPTGWYNTADGCDALYNDTTGSQNTAVGAQALFHNTIGSDNTALGFDALFKNTGSTNPSVPLGDQNTAVGSQALASNTGGQNTAIGFQALYSNTGGYNDGFFGDGNTAVGCQALLSLHGISSGSARGNVAVGGDALQFVTTGAYNIAVGTAAGQYLTTGEGNIDIGNLGMCNKPWNRGESHTIRIGCDSGPFGYQTRTFIAAIRGVTTDNDDAIHVVIDSAGQLGTTSSSARFKTNIKPMDKASEAILALKPVTFRYKANAKGNEHFGLIAEDVAKVNPDLVVRNADGQIYTVRYDAVNAMLLNEFLKEHSRTEKLEAKVAQQEKQIEALTAGLQKVSAQLELRKPLPQTVLNNR